MPEYLAPGVYVEETSFRHKTIEGVSTSTAGFVGPTRFGPTEGESELITSFGNFEQIYGGLDQLHYSGTKMDNFLAHAVRAFFEQGGKRLYVARVFKKGVGEVYGQKTITDGASPGVHAIELKARYPGKVGNFSVKFIFRVGQNILSEDSDGYPILRGARNYDLVWVRDISSPISSPPGLGMLYWLEPYFYESRQRNTFRLRRNDPDSSDTSDVVHLDEPGAESVQVVTVNVTIGPLGQFGKEQSWENLSFHPDHRSALGKIFAPEPTNNRRTSLYVPLEFKTNLKNGVDIAETLLAQPSLPLISPPGTLLETLCDGDATDADRILEVLLESGDDGARPTASEFEGDDGKDTGLKSGLRAFEDLGDISIVAAPGYSSGYETGYKTNSNQIMQHLISHCERMRYRIAVLDSAEKHLISQVRAYRGKVDSKYAALYYPWVTVLDPVTEQEVNLPPSGFVSGIYARNDVEYGVHKAPANEVVRMAVGFETVLNKAQQDVLNPEGINCFRFFEGRGNRLWGARTISSDSEWKYVNLRRYFAYLERSVDKGTQWIVFANNNEALWTNVHRTVEDFLFNEWKSGHLMGEKPEEAYFVRCDRSTMTQNDIDNGRLICLVGVAPVRPAEFVIFRIGQWTADHRH